MKKGVFTYTNLLNCFCRKQHLTIQTCDEIEEFLNDRLKALERLKRANTNFRNFLLKKYIKKIQESMKDENTDRNL